MKGRLAVALAALAASVLLATNYGPVKQGYLRFFNFRGGLVGEAQIVKCAKGVDCVKDNNVVTIQFNPVDRPPLPSPGAWDETVPHKRRIWGLGLPSTSAGTTTWQETAFFDSPTALSAPTRVNDDYPWIYYRGTGTQGYRGLTGWLTMDFDPKVVQFVKWQGAPYKVTSTDSPCGAYDGGTENFYEQVTQGYVAFGISTASELPSVLNWVPAGTGPTLGIDCTEAMREGWGGTRYLNCMDPNYKNPWAGKSMANQSSVEAYWIGWVSHYGTFAHRCTDDLGFPAFNPYCFKHAANERCTPGADNALTCCYADDNGSSAPSGRTECSFMGYVPAYSPSDYGVVDGGNPSMNQYTIGSFEIDFSTGIGYCRYRWGDGGYLESRIPYGDEPVDDDGSTWAPFGICKSGVSGNRCEFYSGSIYVEIN